MRFLTIFISFQLFFLLDVSAAQILTCANESICGAQMIEPKNEVDKICEGGALRVIAGEISAVTCDCNCTLHEDVSWFYDERKKIIVQMESGMLVRSSYFNDQEKLVYDSLGAVPLCSDVNKNLLSVVDFLSLESNEINGSYCFDVSYIGVRNGVDVYSSDGTLISDKKISNVDFYSPIFLSTLIKNKNTNDNSKDILSIDSILEKCRSTCVASDMAIFKLSANEMNVVSVEKLNDYGFYLWKNGMPTEAVKVLRVVVKRNCDRIPAYLNLADALWDIDEKSEAYKNYDIYVKKMKISGKENKIPERVLVRIRSR